MDTPKDSSPHLPSVRTFQKDAQHAENTIDGVTLTVPPQEQSVSSDTLLSDIGHQGRTKNMAKKVSFDVERAFNNEMVQEGTIVTDRKQARLGIAALLKLAVIEWWKKTQRSVEETVQKIESSSLFEEKNKETVAAPETRTEVIEKAGLYTQHIPHDDHAHVVEKVRSFAQSGSKDPGPTLIVKAPSPLQTPSWGNGGAIPSTPLYNMPAPKPSVPEKYEKGTSVISPLRPLSAFTPKAPEKAVLPRVSIAPPTLDLRGKPLSLPTTGGKGVTPSKPHLPIGSWSHFTDSTDTPRDAQKTVPTDTFIPPQKEEVKRDVPPPRPVIIPLPRAPLPPPSLPRSPLPPSSTPQHATPVKSEEVTRPLPIRVETNPIVSERTRDNEKPLQPSHEKRSFIDHIPRSLILAGIVIIGVTFGVMAAFSHIEKADTEPTTEGVSPREGNQPLLTTDETVTLTLHNTREETMIALSQTVHGSASTSVALILSPRTESDLEQATVERALQHIAPNAPRAFVRSLEPAYALGGIRTTTMAPYIVLQSKNFDTAFAGMLMWERSMSADLSPFFGEEVNKTLVPRNDGTASVAHFVDGLVDNQPMRVLYDELGNEHVVYGFVRDDTIVITTSTEAFREVRRRIETS